MKKFKYQNSKKTSKIYIQKKIYLNQIKLGEPTKINEIKKCVQCPHCIILPDPDPYDWFCDDDVKLFCEKLKRTVAAALRPYESDEVDIPSDCPLE